ncbi:MFS transporter [Streptomyces sp. 5-6(2022)]|uniref:MFS transporter n=1 Tax=Streptomyces sp. 5-6(2022) TaxID=2936510 RepID=UPI0023B9B08A|nr:MFS transporter [Streptomyces sp. 5-6(2022)]
MLHSLNERQANMKVKHPAHSIRFDEAPVMKFHWRVGTASATGSLSDGYVLGVSGIALATAAQSVKIDDVWMGLLASATLIGLFVGALVAGRLVDRFGRKPLYGPLMLVFAVVSLLQFWAEPGWSLFAIRLILGLLLGGDYVASKALLAEYSPAHWRGRALSMLGIAWAAGFASAYVIGLFLRDIPDIGWRLILISSAIPALSVFLLRLGIPESPRWLVQQGQAEQARAIVSEKFGTHVALPEVAVPASTSAARTRDLFGAKLVRRTLIACMAYAIGVMPNFALGTFSPYVLKTLGVHNPFVGALGYNVCVAIGALLGYFVVDRMGRRALLFGGFLISAALLAPLTFSASLDPMTTLVLFAVFALVFISTGNVVYVYPAELFPTQLRGQGVGLAVAASRLGSAVTTFLMPVVVGAYGISAALGACMVLLVAGGIAGFIWGPETANQALSESDDD